MHSSDLLNVTACVFGGHLADQAHGAFPCLASVSATNSSSDSTVAEPLAGATYKQAKQVLVQQEQLVLRSIRFNITVDQPHRYLLNYCKALRCSAPIAQLALCLLNDAVCTTTLDAATPAALLAAGCLAVALQLMPEFPSAAPEWQAGLGLQQADVDAAGQRLLTALSSAR